jgi:hypothetical protein
LRPWRAPFFSCVPAFGFSVATRPLFSFEYAFVVFPALQ